MKKLILFLAGMIALIIFIGSIGPLIGLAVCLGIFILALKQFFKSKELASKVLWGIIGLIVLSGAISNIPALIGIVAVIGLYYIYREWNKEKESKEVGWNDDPFANFERQWEELSKKL